LKLVPAKPVSVDAGKRKRSAWRQSSMRLIAFMLVSAFRLALFG